MQDKIMTEKDSLSIIQQMISTAKKEQNDDGRGWITWGWLLFGASVLSFLNARWHWANQYFFWNVTGSLTLVLTQVLFMRKSVGVKTYTADLFSKLNIGFFVSMIFTVIAINLDVVTPMGGFAFLISLYAFWALIYGTALHFRPSVLAAFALWGLAVVALFAKTFEQTMMIHALATLTGFIVPGHLAARSFRKLQKQETKNSAVV